MFLFVAIESEFGIIALKESHPPWRLFPPAKVAQAPVYSYLLMQKVWEKTSLALMLIAAVAGLCQV